MQPMCDNKHKHSANTQLFGQRCMIKAIENHNHAQQQSCGKKS
jgi:hypothetical protein